MGFFNELGKKTTETTSKIAKETKLKLKITENKGKIKDLYSEIGRKIYENHVKEEKEDVETLVSDDCEAIDNLAKEIEDARMEVLKLNNKKVCDKCFAEIEKDASFCSKCGKKQKPVKDDIKKEEKKESELEKILKEDDEKVEENNEKSKK